jgi:hypothetical protein
MGVLLIFGGGALLCGGNNWEKVPLGACWLTNGNFELIAIKVISPIRSKVNMVRGLINRAHKRNGENYLYTTTNAYIS